MRGCTDLQAPTAAYCRSAVRDLGGIVQQRGVHGVPPILDRLGVLATVRSALGMRIERGFVRPLGKDRFQQASEGRDLTDRAVVGNKQAFQSRPSELRLDLIGMYQPRPDGDRDHLAAIEDRQASPQLPKVLQPHVIRGVRIDVIEQIPRGNGLLVSSGRSFGRPVDAIPDGK